ncbi:MAG: enoyl-CoA hydratase/isomerase family protein [Desulfuromonadales bacterium]|jgi:enoyl-CoA hydratase/carnithine racemase|nr:enoyl-CoA hydratase/isomerase family protein [Desulfuromonadales bacterium]
MSKVTVTMQGETAVLRLDNGATNAISSELVADLTAAVAQVRASARGLVLAGNQKFFSIGFNLPELVQLDHAAMTEFFTRFDLLCLDLYTLAMPSACAMTGHAVAGGNVLALTCDFRFAAEGKKLIGLNEATIGLPVPYLPDLILRQVVGDRAATEMMYHGQFLPSSRAAEIGLVDAVLPLAEVEEQAVAKVNTLAALPRGAFAIIKENRTEAVRRNYELYSRAKLARMLECWFDDSVQTLLKEAAKSF